MKSINYVLIRKDGRTITGQHPTFFETASRVREMFGDDFYDTPENPIKKVFMSDGVCLVEYLPSEVKDLANWTEGR